MQDEFNFTFNKILEKATKMKINHIDELQIVISPECYLKDRAYYEIKQGATMTLYKKKDDYC